MSATVPEDLLEDEGCWRERWGIWEQASSPESGRYFVRLSIRGEEIRGRFPSREAAQDFHSQQLSSKLGWPRQHIAEPERHPQWDHPAELEPQKEYSFLETSGLRPRTARRTLSEVELGQFSERGFLLGLPVLGAEELARIKAIFEELLSSRIDRAPSDEQRFRAAHTISRPLHQELVVQLAKHERVLAIVEDLLGQHFVCWSAHLFCKLPGDPTEQPWHQDAGFWPLSQSRALTLWLAFDDVDEANSSVTFIEGSHRLARLPWQPTGTTHHLLTQQIPDVDLLGRAVPSTLRAGECSVHSDLTVHGSRGNGSTRRRAGLALRFVAADATCLGPMINGYRMNGGCLLPKGPASDPSKHWKALRRRPGGRRTGPKFPGAGNGDEAEGARPEVELPQTA